MITLDLAQKGIPSDPDLQNLGMALVPASATRVKADAEMLSILSRHAGVGLWDAVLYDADPMHARSKWSWSSEFRRLLGFQTISDFPDVVFSWSDRLHSDDADETFTALYACLADTTGQTRYDVAFRLKTQDHSYRLFRSIGGATRDRHGKALRICGSLIDINETGVVEAQHRHSLQQLADTFNAGIISVAKAVTASSTALQSAGRHIAKGLSQASSQASAATVDAHNSNVSLESVAAEAKGLCDFESGLAGQFTELVRVTSLASADTSRTNDTVQKLAGAASRISEVVKLIAAIAGQANLLALNATIEAARAGDAGRGFTLVAGEIKALATQTAQANEEIALQIAAVQDEALRTLAAVQQITFAVDHARKFSHIIASAVEQQHTAMQQISQNLQRCVESTLHVSKGIRAITQTTSNMDEASVKLLASVHQLADQSNQLRADTSDFLDALCTAEITDD